MKHMLTIKKIFSLLLLGTIVLNSAFEVRASYQEEEVGMSIGTVYPQKQEEEEEHGEKVYMNIITVDYETGEVTQTTEWRYEDEVLNDSLEDWEYEVVQTVTVLDPNDPRPVNEDTEFREYDLNNPFVRILNVDKNEKEKLVNVNKCVSENYVSMPVEIYNHEKGTVRKFTSWRPRNEEIGAQTQDWDSDVEPENINWLETSSGKLVPPDTKSGDLARYFSENQDECLVVHKNIL